MFEYCIKELSEIVILGYNDLYYAYNYALT